MQYRPKRNNKNAILAAATLVACVGICIVAEISGVGYHIVDETLILLFITAALYIFIRYVLFDYVYHVRDDHYIDIVRVTSNVPSTLISVRMSSTDLVVKVEGDMKSKYPDIVKKNKYNLSLFPKNTYWYIYSLDGARYALVLEGDEQFFDYLKEQIRSIDPRTEETDDEVDE